MGWMVEMVPMFTTCKHTHHLTSRELYGGYIVGRVRVKVNHLEQQTLADVMRHNDDVDVDVDAVYKSEKVVNETFSPFSFFLQVCSYLSSTVP